MHTSIIHERSSAVSKKWVWCMYSKTLPSTSSRPRKLNALHYYYQNEQVTCSTTQVSLKMNIVLAYVFTYILFQMHQHYWGWIFQLPFLGNLKKHFWSCVLSGPSMLMYVQPVHITAAGWNQCIACLRSSFNPILRKVFTPSSYH